jgi:hypothetical protein
MVPISNSGILNLNASSCAVGFTPAATYAYSSGASTMTITDTSSFPAGDDLTIIHVYVNDGFGGVAQDKIEAAAGNVVVSTAGLNPLCGYSVRVTFVTDNGLVADASAYHIGTTAPASGAVQYKNVDAC